MWLRFARRLYSHMHSMQHSGSGVWPCARGTRGTTRGEFMERLYEKRSLRLVYPKSLWLSLKPFLCRYFLLSQTSTYARLKRIISRMQPFVYCGKLVAWWWWAREENPTRGIDTFQASKGHRQISCKRCPFPVQCSCAPQNAIRLY